MVRDHLYFILGSRQDPPRPDTPRGPDPGFNDPHRTPGPIIMGTKPRIPEGSFKIAYNLLDPDPGL